MKTQEQLDRLNKKIIESAKNTNNKMDKEVEVINTNLDSVNVSQSIGFITLCEAGLIDAVTATEHADIFIDWVEGLDCYAGRIVKRNDALYQVNEGQGHTAQTGWEPENAPSLFKKIGDPAEEWPAWSQPVGAHDLYDEGDKVTHLEKKWVSTVPDNVWEPGVYGWEEVVEETEEEPETPEIPGEESEGETTTLTGTIDDPIPFSNGMEVFADKYYTYEGVLYLCIRDSGQALYNTPSELVGIYFEEVVE